jgi:hypothetical protein
MRPPYPPEQPKSSLANRRLAELPLIRNACAQSRQPWKRPMGVSSGANHPARLLKSCGVTLR